ncbi:MULTISPECIES: diiron oxygenase [Pseudomonas]|uniref:Para-aminobenzoate N-oxygenase AurF n=1 Tax=Pseudomonas baetica TaxID=674054 RepID=A0ABX4Q1F6_9PSED|nr:MULTISPECIES: diiron oxygenase [Pseudomonas]MDR9863792.1 diiron oxygenase [Pseudomonas baetica]PKA70624.1 para-aminobenzoate N-oxygenase AurF [Pseudomonas baetica]PTC16375.1 aminobenzoate oxygenase [Pseudomonas baetica]
MSTLTGEQDQVPVSWALRFTLGDWNSHASVRVSQDDYQLPEDVQQQLETRYWFPPAFLPYLSHPAIEAEGRAVLHRLTANHLVHFLDYTTLLEHRIVNRAVETIIHGELPAFVPPRMKNAALQLYTDEGYHALFSHRLAEQIAALYGIAERPVMPLRITRFNALIARTSASNRPLAWFLLGFVSETIIARELLDVCRESLVSSVNDMLRDHLTDEARHSRYFAEVFHYLWLTLNSRQRTFSAKTLLEIITLFFEVDERWLQKSLHGAGIGETAVREILDSLTHRQASCQRAKNGATATLDALRKAGFFALPNNQKLFAKAGLIDG